MGRYLFPPRPPEARLTPSSSFPFSYIFLAGKTNLLLLRERLRRRKRGGEEHRCAQPLLFFQPSSVLSASITKPITTSQRHKWMGGFSIKKTFRAMQVMFKMKSRSPPREKNFRGKHSTLILFRRLRSFGGTWKEGSGNGGEKTKGRNCGTAGDDRPTPHLQENLLHRP